MGNKEKKVQQLRVVLGFVKFVFFFWFCVFFSSDILQNLEVYAFFWGIGVVRMDFDLQV